MTAAGPAADAGAGSEGGGRGVAPGPQAPLGDRGGAGHHALVVSGDAARRAQCRGALTDLGLTVAAAGSAVAAVRAARRQRPDVILMDAQLSDGPGTQALVWLRSDPALAATPAVLVSASPEDAAEIGRFGIRTLLRIPTSAETVARTVRQVLGAGAG